MATDPTIIKGSYYQDLLDQPRALEATVAGLRSAPELETLAAGLGRGVFSRVVLTGMGSSYHGLHPLHLHLAGRGIASTMMETSELIHYGRALLTPDTLVVAVSQSGGSAETLHLLDLNRDQAAILAVTNTAGSPLAQRSRACVLTQAGPEHSVSCKTYVSALAAMAWLGDILCREDTGATLADLACAPALVKAFLADLDDRAMALAGELDGIRSLFLVGRGPSLATVGTGALITKEAAHFHAEGMSSAAFRHGPLEMVHEAMHVMVFAGGAATSALNLRLMDEIRGHGGHTSLVDTDPAPARIRPILEILPVEAVTLALAARAGMEAGAFRWATKITTVE